MKNGLGRVKSSLKDFLEAYFVEAGRKIQVIGLILYGDNEGIWLVGRDFTFIKLEKNYTNKRSWSLTSLTDDEAYEWYELLTTNQPLLQRWESLNSITELEKPPREDSGWTVPPIELKSCDGTFLGTVGVAVSEETETETELRAVYVSVDGTWATITCWIEGNRESEDSAQEDMREVARGLLEMCEKIPLNNEKKD